MTISRRHLLTTAAAAAIVPALPAPQVSAAYVLADAAASDANLWASYEWMTLRQVAEVMGVDLDQQLDALKTEAENYSSARACITSTIVRAPLGGRRYIDPVKDEQ